MQHLASEFSKIFRGWYPRTLTAGGGDLWPGWVLGARGGRGGEQCWSTLWLHAISFLYDARDCAAALRQKLASRQRQLCKTILDIENSTFDRRSVKLTESQSAGFYWPSVAVTRNEVVS